MLRNWASASATRCSPTPPPAAVRPCALVFGKRQSTRENIYGQGLGFRHKACCATGRRRRPLAGSPHLHLPRCAPCAPTLA